MILHTNFHLPILILLLKRSCTQDPKFQVVSNFFVYSDHICNQIKGIEAQN